MSNVEITKPAVGGGKSNMEAARIAAELGLAVQAARHEKPLASEVFKRMTPDEEAVWRAFAPTVYLEEPVKGMRLLKSYAFDTVPVEVLKHWKRVRDEFSFDSFQVWTTERAQLDALDPLLVGVVGDGRYLLARWGDEAPGLLSFEEVCATVLRRGFEKAARRISVATWPWQNESRKVEVRRDATLKHIEYNNHMAIYRAAAAASRILKVINEGRRP